MQNAKKNKWHFKWIFLISGFYSLLSAAPDTTPERFKHLTINKTPSITQQSSFLYTLLPDTKRIGLLTYDSTNLITNTSSPIEFETITILECGDSLGFVAREGYINHQIEKGKTGYESKYSPCHLARNFEYKWFKGKQLGANTWYSRDLKGDVQCYSINGINCLWEDNGYSSISRTISDNTTIRSLENSASHLQTFLDSSDILKINTSDGNWTGNLVLPQNTENGKTFTLNVNSTYSVTLHNNSITSVVKNGSSITMIRFNNKWTNSQANFNKELDFMINAIPLSCGSQHNQLHGSTGYDTQNHWCSKLLSPEQSLHSNNVQEMIADKLNHMDLLFDQMSDWSLSKIEADNNYTNRLNTLNNQLTSKGNQVDDACAWWSVWNGWGAIACGIISKEYNDIVDEYNSLLGERNAKRSSAITLVNSGRNSHWHELHEKWAQNDNTHFAALLKEESLSLKDLKLLKTNYDKTAGQKHQEYLTAVQKYMSDTDPKNIVKDIAEDLPLVGPEIRHIVDYAENPSDKNLRKMLLGIAGPVGEAVEGGIELSTEDGGLGEGKLKFLTDVLTDLNNDDTIGDALEDIVSDAINDLGDEAIESIRQSGLWTDHPSDDPPIDLDFADVVDLRSQLPRFEYDPWSDTQNLATNFQNNFTPIPSNYFTYLQNPQTSITNLEYASNASVFDNQMTSIFAHSFGKDYAKVAQRNPTYRNWSQTKINQELYKVLADPAYYEQRIPRWVTSSTIGQRPAGLIYDNDHAVIVLNSDFLDADDDLGKFYFEELGHLLNWWRCKIFDVTISYCETNGDAGARFRDAAVLNQNLHTSPLELLLPQLPAHTEVDKVPVKFNSNKLATLEGWPNYYTMNDHIVSSGKFNWLMRLGLDIASEYPAISDEFDLEVSISAPSPSKKGNPWEKATCDAKDGCYCKTDLDTNCNMPTMWITVSFRDAIKASIAKTPQVKDSKFAKTGFDISPRLVRKHGGKLPFQLTSVNGTDWDYQSLYNIYYKKFTMGLEAKLDLWKMGHAIKGAKPSSVHKPEISFKSTPAEGSYLVEIATKDTEDFAGWLAGDIASAVAGCAAGFAIGIVAEQDPVLFCHGFSDLTEAVETAFQGLDKKPTMLFEADGNVTLPASLEYKYATSGNTPSNPIPSTTTGRVTYNSESGTNVWFTDGGTQQVTSTTDNAQINSFKSKAGRAFSKLGARSISPVAVFRFRVGFDYAEKILQKGEYNLPSAIVGD